MNRKDNEGNLGGVLVLIPTYNEVGNIDPLINSLEDQDCIDWILFVDDSSTDGTLEKLQVLQEKYDNLFIYQRPKKRGLGTALRDGFRIALERFPFNLLVQMDSDLSHDPAFIPKMLLSRSKVVVGSRYVDGGKILGWSLYRKLLSRGANFLARTLLGLKVRDVTSGYRMYSRRAVKTLAWETSCRGYEFQVEAIWLTQKHGMEVEEIPIMFTERFCGESKLHGVSEVRKLLTFLLKIRWGRQ